MAVSPRRHQEHQRIPVSSEWDQEIRQLAPIVRAIGL